MLKSVGFMLDPSCAAPHGATWVRGVPLIVWEQVHHQPITTAANVPLVVAFR